MLQNLCKKMEQKNSLQQKQQSKQGYYLSQQHLKLMHIMHLNTLALQDYISNEIEINPALEVVNTEQDTENDNGIEDKLSDEELWNVDNEWLDKKTTTSSTDFYEAPVVQYESLQEKIKEQLHWMNIDHSLLQLALFLVDEMDDDGMLRRETTDVADDFSFSRGKQILEGQMEKALEAIQKCDPPGVGARSVVECLLLQLQRNKSVLEKHPGYAVAERLISVHFNDLSQKQYTRILKELKITNNELQQALGLIAKLSPHPVIEASKYELYRERIIPDFELVTEGDELAIHLNSSQWGSLRVNTEMEAYTGISDVTSTKQASVFCQNLMDDAHALVDALKEREVSMLKVIRYIVTKQRGFFKCGDNKQLVPMVQQDVALATGLDISTVSRIVSNKYIQTPFGTFCLKNLFVRAVPNNKDENSSQSVLNVRDMIADLIADEDKKNPLSDLQVVEMLNSKKINIARRTVVKYRGILGIPNSSQRKEK